MIDLIEPKINKYLKGLINQDDAVLQEMEKLAEKWDFPIVGFQVGQILYLMAKLKNPKVIFELGSGFGYSAWWFARAIGAKAKVHWTDRSQENFKLAKDFLKKANLEQKIVFHFGDAIQSLKSFNGKVDLLFVDMDKESYPAAYRLFKERCRKGAVLIADNMLWDGRVIRKSKEASTQGIQEFTRLVFDDPDMVSTILPIRDGVLISILN